VRRAAVLLAAVAGLVAAPAASAHPLGNFSFNHLSEVRISSDRVEVTYLLDQAEIPTFQERDESRAGVIADKRAEVLGGLGLTVDGRPRELTPASPPQLELRPGQGGLQTTRFELDLAASVNDARHVELHDGTFTGRLGWRAVVIKPGDGTAVRSDAPSGDPTNRLTQYPADLLASPLDRRDGTFEVGPGDGTVVAPQAEGGDAVKSGGEDGFAGLFANAASGQGVLVLLLIAAFGWGALHALSPGHGKAMVAAYLVGTRGGPRHAVALGAVVTVTHTIGVFALGLVTLALSQYVLPEDLYPWLTLVSGLLVVAVGAGVLRSRLRARAHEHHHHHHHDVSWKGVLGMGASAGLIPCPSALVVLLGAIAQHEVGLGLVLIVAFSLGLAATLTGLGLAVVYAGRLTTRLHMPPRVVTALPAVSAAVIVVVGCVLTAGAVPDVLSS
jgi:nickel/cobalt transporter (NicO) family protein